MNRRNFLKSSAALTVSTAVLKNKAIAQVSQSNHVYDPTNIWTRPVHLVYARSGGKALVETDDVLLNAWDQVPGGITAMTPFLLNVANPSKYASIISEVQARGITITPGVGGPGPGNQINTSQNQAIVAASRQYTDYIRLENCQGFADNPNGQADLQGMIDYCCSLGFTRIMLNPWPKDNNGNIIPFANPQLDSSFNNVMLDFNRKTYELTVPLNPNNWLVNQTYAELIQAYRPSCNIVVNYESAPQHQALLQLEKDNPGSSIPAMNITATQCENSPNNLHWAPPFTEIYDPIALGTWPWIANRLGDFMTVNVTTTATLSEVAGGYQAMVTVKNTGTGTAANVQLTVATLGSASGAPVPQSLGDLPRGSSATAVVTFPSSAGASGARSALHFTGTYDGGTFGGNTRTVLP